MSATPRIQFRDMWTEFHGIVFKTAEVLSSFSLCLEAKALDRSDDESFHPLQIAEILDVSHKLIGFVAKLSQQTTMYGPVRRTDYEDDFPYGLSDLKALSIDRGVFVAYAQDVIPRIGHEVFNLRGKLHSLCTHAVDYERVTLDGVQTISTGVLVLLTSVIRHTSYVEDVHREDWSDHDEDDDDDDNNEPVETAHDRWRKIRAIPDQELALRGRVRGETRATIYVRTGAGAADGSADGGADGGCGAGAAGAGKRRRGET